MYANIADKMSLQVSNVPWFGAGRRWALTLDSQEEAGKRHHGWHMQDADLDIVHIMTYMRQRAANSSVFLVEFFRDFDV